MNSVLDNCFKISVLCFIQTAELMNTDEKKPFIKPSTMASKNSREEQQMTCERLLTGDDAV